MEDFKKKFTNIWYYYKVPIIIGIIALFVIVTTVVNKVNEPKYDHSIAIISKANYPSQEEVDKLKDVFEEKYGGECIVVIYNVALGEIGEDDVTISKLSLDLGNRISDFLFIEDLDKFLEVANNIDINTQGLGKEFDWLKDCGVDELWLTTRIPEK